MSLCFLWMILGVTGATMKIDRNGDSEGNFSVLALVPTSDNIVYNNYRCNYQMRPVGQFFQLDSAYPVSEFIVFLFLRRFTSAKTINSLFHPKFSRTR